MTIVQIRYFITVAKCLSFTQAAEQLFVTQPALSKQITAMETELNMLLFLRHRNHTIELTPAGKLLLSQFEGILFSYDKTVEEARQVAFCMNKELRIGLLYGEYTSDFLRPSIQEIRAKYPNLNVIVQNYNASELTEKLYRKELDLIITHYFAIERLENLQFQILLRSWDNLVMSKSHPLAMEEPLDLKRLDGVKFLIISQKDYPTSVQLLEKWFRQLDVHPDVQYGQDTDTVKLMVEQGYGISVLDARDTMQFYPDIVFRPFQAFWNPSQTAVWHQDCKNDMLPVFLKIINKHIKNLKALPVWHP